MYDIPSDRNWSHANQMQNLYAELTFVCPSYWMAEAYSSQGHTTFKYQFSPLPGTHGADLEGYQGPLGGSLILSVDFQRAFMSTSLSFPLTNGIY